MCIIGVFIGRRGGLTLLLHSIFRIVGISEFSEFLKNNFWIVKKFVLNVLFWWGWFCGGKISLDKNIIFEISVKILMRNLDNIIYLPTKPPSNMVYVETIEINHG